MAIDEIRSADNQYNFSRNVVVEIFLERKIIPPIIKQQANGDKYWHTFGRCLVYLIDNVPGIVNNSDLAGEQQTIFLNGK